METNVDGRGQGQESLKEFAVSSWTITRNYHRPADDHSQRPEPTGSSGQRPRRPSRARARHREGGPDESEEFARPSLAIRRPQPPEFLGTGVAGTAAMLTGWLTSFAKAVPAAAARIAGDDAPWLEKTIPQLQGLMASRQLTSKELTQGYLDRIASLNPLLHAVIETNPQAVAIAVQRDNERAQPRRVGWAS